MGDSTRQISEMMDACPVNPLYHHAMFTFFHGWRRKAGVVTLVVALAFIGGWLKSRYLVDSVEVCFGNHTVFILTSADQIIGVQYIFERLPESNPSFPIWQSGINDGQAFSALFSDERITWYWRCCGFSAGEYADSKLYGCRCAYFHVPYWSAAIPLTLLSAYLILWNSRERSSGTPQS